MPSAFLSRDCAVPDSAQDLLSLARTSRPTPHNKTNSGSRPHQRLRAWCPVCAGKRCPASIHRPIGIGRSISIWKGPTQSGLPRARRLSQHRSAVGLGLLPATDSVLSIEEWRGHDALPAPHCLLLRCGSPRKPPAIRKTSHRNRQPGGCSPSAGAWKGSLYRRRRVRGLTNGQRPTIDAPVPGEGTARCRSPHSAKRGFSGSLVSGPGSRIILPKAVRRRVQARPPAVQAGVPTRTPRS